MGQIEELFYNDPLSLFHIREISRITKIPKSTVARKIASLIKEGIIIEDKDVFKGFRANETSNSYILKKRDYALNQIRQSGLIEYVEENLFPKSIIIFGSIAKGCYTRESDIDLFVQSISGDIDLSNYEKILGREIQLFAYPDLTKIQPHLANNILNGIKVSGFIDLF